MSIFNTITWASSYFHIFTQNTNSVVNCAQKKSTSKFLINIVGFLPDLFFTQPYTYILYLLQENRLHDARSSSIKLKF